MLESLSTEFSEITSDHYSYTATITGFELLSINPHSYPFTQHTPAVFPKTTLIAVNKETAIREEQRYLGVLSTVWLCMSSNL